MASFSESEIGYHKKAPLESLTGIRFIAALMVFTSHFPIPGSSGILLATTQAGYCGVTLFFILSGFVLTYNYFDNFSISEVGNYFIARIARIYPLYLFIMLMLWIGTGSVEHITTYLFATQAWSSDLNVVWGIDAPAWSVSVEVFLYLMFPILLFLVNRNPFFSSLSKLVFTSLLLIFSIFLLATYFALTAKGLLPHDDPQSSHRWLYIIPITRLLDFSLGIVAAVIYLKYGRRLSQYTKRWSLLSYLSFVLIFTCMPCSQIFYSPYSWNALFVIPFLGLIISLAMNVNSWLSKILASDIMVSLGAASYAFYLIHFPAKVLYFGNSLPTGRGKIGAYLFFFILVTALAYGLHKLIEEPCRIYLRKGWLKLPGIMTRVMTFTFT